MNKADVVTYIKNKVVPAEQEKVDTTKLESLVNSEYNGINMKQLLVKFFIDSKLYKSLVEYYESRNNHLLNDALKIYKNYKLATNAASGSKYDQNANVINKNIATLNGELPKGMLIALNRELLYSKIEKMYGKDMADEYLRLLYSHFIYKNDETNIANYCASVTLYPWLLNGTKDIGGNSTPPTNLKAFCGGFINLVFIISGMLSGATATPEFLMYMSYFIEKEYGDDYPDHINDVVDLSLKKRTLGKIITDCFEQIVYSLNQPTGARNFQSVFWNVAYYDKYYFEGIFGEFKFPDGKKPIWKNVSFLQKYFMKWFNKERTKTVITFPVETMALLTENGKPKDYEYGEFTAEMYTEGHSFFTYLSDNPDSLSSCCRLRNEITSNEFSYTLGAGGVSTGSKSVLTVNVNRVVQDIKRRYDEWSNNVPEGEPVCAFEDYLKEEFAELIDKMHKFQLAYDDNLYEMYDAGLLPLFSSGFIALNRQYLTIGVNGIVEAAEFLGLDITPNDEYAKFVELILGTIEEKNIQYRTKKVLFNCEMIPAESVGVKHARWDKEDGYVVPRDCYNSYFYKSEDSTLSIIDKFKLHGEKFIKHLTGGSANHVNLDSHLSKDQYVKVIEIAAKYGCNYFTFNIPNTVCNDCGHIDKRYLKECPVCHSKNVDYLTRIIGYLRLISNFSQGRQLEAGKRHYLNLIDNSDEIS